MKKFTILALVLCAFASTVSAQYPIADNTPNPPAQYQRVFPMLFDGTTWDRLAGYDGVLYTRAGGGTTWTCSLDNLGATLTQCQAAPGAGLKLYVTDVVITSTTTTAGLYLLRYGTGTNCGTGTTSLLPSAATVPRLGYPGNASPPAPLQFGTPIAPAANNALCIICTAVNTCTVQLSGYSAP